MGNGKVSSGNPDPSPDTRFGAVRGPATGKTKEQKKNEMRASELASKMTVDMMEAFVSIVESATDNEAKAAVLSSDLLNLIKEANNRAHGTPKASIEVESPGGSMTPHVIQIVGKQDDDG